MLPPASPAAQLNGPITPIMARRASCAASVRTRGRFVVFCLAVCVAGNARPATAELPEVAPGHWYEIPASSLRASGLIRDVDASVSKITAWSGAALDAEANRLLVWGGGHADYAGNEVYAFDLGSLTWTRLSQPPAPADREKSDQYADGSPRSRHTYDYIEFVPSVDRLLSFGGAALYPRGSASTRRISEFDPTTRSWITGRRADVPAGGNMIGAHARLDPASGDVFFLACQRAALARYSPGEDRWRVGRDKSYVRVHATAAIDPKRRWFVLIGSGTDSPQALRWHLDRPGRAVDLRPVTSGDKEIERAYAPGFDFHGPSGRFVAWAGGGDVYVLDADAWKWMRRAPAPGNGALPHPQLATGTYGRFRYVPGLDLFVLMNGVDRNVFMYRLAPL
jgi:hypothetical protein